MIRKLLKFVFIQEYRKKHISLYRIRKANRYTSMIVEVFSRPLQIVDSMSFLHQYQEIFIAKIYKFNASSSTPYIIDAGANIGMATLYWKTTFPDAKVVCFEPDLKICNALEYNINSFGFLDVEIVNKGLWKEAATLSFNRDGADAGRVEDGDGDESLSVEVVELSPYLNRKVDFLKIDIEGAEFEVLQECKENLLNVENIFIEYHSSVNSSQSLADILQILTKAGFRYYIHHTGIYNSSPFMEIRSQQGYDLQLNIYGIRE